MATDYKCLGQHQAYVMAGKSKAEREARYLETPKELRPQIASHIRTIAKIKQKAELNRRR